jgi:hypothetical protein
MIVPTRLSAILLLLPIWLTIATAGDNSSSFLALTKQKTEIQYVVATIEGNCHASQTTANREQLSEAKKKYDLASAAYNAWLQQARNAVLNRSLLKDETKVLWSRANDATNVFVDFSLKTCGGVQPGDPTPEPLKSGRLLVSFEDMQALVKSLRGSSPNQRKQNASLLLKDEWEESTFSGRP